MQTQQGNVKQSKYNIQEAQQVKRYYLPGQNRFLRTIENIKSGASFVNCL